MKKTLLTLCSALFLSGMLAGCNWDDDNNANNDNRQPRNVTYRADDQADRNERNGDGLNLVGPDNADNAGDVNRNGTTANQDRGLSKKIADRANKVDGVDRAHVVATDDRVLIGLDRAEAAGDNNANLDEEVRSAVQPLAGDRDVYVSSDENLVKRITDVEADLNTNGNEGANEVRSDVLGIIDDLTKAIRRPFENNER